LSANSYQWEVKMEFLAGEATWWWCLIVDQVAASSILVTSACLAVGCKLSAVN